MSGVNLQAEPRDRGFASPRAGPKLCSGVRIGLVVLLALAVGAPVSAAPRQGFSATLYTNRSGLPQGQCLAIHQDQRGYLWFGTYGGAARYNGSGFDTYGVSDGLAGHVVRAIVEDSRGRVLIGTEGGISVFDGARFSTLVVADGLPIDTVTAILPAPDGSLWVSTESGVVHVLDDSVDRYTRASGLPDSAVRHAFVDADGSVWLGTDSGLARLRDGRIEVIEALLGSSVTAVLADSLGVLWVGTTTGIVSSVDRVSFQPLVYGTADARLTTVTTAVADVSGDMWFGTRAGVLHVHGANVDVLGAAHGLEHWVYATYVDRERNVWAGTDAGVTKLVPGAFKTYGKSSGLPSDSVRDIAEDNEGRIWLTTWEGIGVINPNGDIQTIRADRLPATRGYAVAPLPDGSVLYGTNEGLIHWANGRATIFTEADGLPSSFVRAIAPSRSGDWWIGTNDGLARWVDGHIEPVEASAPNSPLVVIDLQEGLDGKLWIASFDGLLTLDGENMTAFEGGEGNHGGAVWSLDMDRDGAIWVGTNGGGAYRIDGDEIFKLGVSEGLVDPFVWQVLVDGSDLWLYTNRGLDRWDGREFTHFDMTDGLPDLEGGADAGLRDSSGRLWFGTARGVASYKPGVVTVAGLPPLVAIESITADGKELDQGSKLELRGSQPRLSVGFAGLTFRDESRTTFRYRLVGFDNGWSEPIQEHRVAFAALPPGEYTFEVEALDARANRSSSPARLAFTIRPGWMESVWIRLLAAPLLLVGVVALQRMRHRRLEADHRRLAEMVDVRTRELVHSEERFRAALINSPTTVFNQDLDLRYTWAHNLRGGTDPESVLGKRDEDLLESAEDAGRLEEIKRHVLESGKGARREVVIVEDEQPVHLDVTVQPLLDGDRKVRGLTCSTTDITAIKALESQLIQSQRLESIGSLAGGIAHDFNNLLTGISGYCQLALAAVSDKQTVADDLQQALQCAERAAGLTRQLLTFSRSQTLQSEVLNPDELIVELIKMLERLIGENVDVEYVANPSVGRIRGDRGQIEQVLVNLAVNARDAITDDGRLTIATANVDVAPGRGVAKMGVAAGPYVRISVIDNGCGIDAQTRDRMFDPFFTTKDVGKGTGLGLAVVYGIVRQHEGHILADSEVGAGTRFDVFIPRVNGLSAAKPDEDDATPGTGAETLLLVEDEEAVRLVAKRVLEAAGYRLHVAADGAQAEELFKQHGHQFDALVTDIVMPGGSGDQLYERLLLVRPDLRVLFMSGYSDRDRPTAGRMLTKPFTAEGLVGAVRAVLDE